MAKRAAVAHRQLAPPNVVRTRLRAFGPTTAKLSALVSDTCSWSTAPCEPGSQQSCQACQPGHKPGRK